MSFNACSMLLHMTLRTRLKFFSTLQMTLNLFKNLSKSLPAIDLSRGKAKSRQNMKFTMFNSLCLSGASVLPRLGTSRAAEQERLSDVKAASTFLSFPVQSMTLLGAVPVQALGSQDCCKSMSASHLLCGCMPDALLVRVLECQVLGCYPTFTVRNECHPLCSLNASTEKPS